MKKIPMKFLALIVPFFMIPSVSADEAAPVATEKTVEATTPSFTFYYFDG